MTTAATAAELDSQIPSTSVFTYLFANERYNEVAFIDPISNKSITRRQLKSDSLRFARSLRNLDTLGQGASLQRGDTITIFSTTSIYYPVIILGAFAAGTPVACSSAAQTPTELAHQFTLTRPKFFAVQLQLLPVFLDTLKLLKVDEKEVIQRSVLICEREELSQSLRQQGWRCIYNLFEGDDDFEPEDFDGQRSSETALIVYSSGTTSLPKGVELTHRNLAATVKILGLWAGFGLDGPLMGPFPFYHIAGMQIFLLAPVRWCRPSVLVSSFVFEDFLKFIVRYKVSSVAVPPAVIGLFASSPLVDKYDMTSVRTVLFGAAPTPQPIINSCYQRLKAIAHPSIGIYQGFGASECTGATVFTPLGRVDKAEAAGHPIGCDMRIVSDTDEDVSPGKDGEVLLRGPGVMRGYLHNPKATKETFTSDGWLKTGDVGYIDNAGFLRIVDRKKEIIKYNSFQVPPAELESVLAGHPKISDVCVVGVPTRDGTNELPRAYVVPRDRALLKDPAFPSEIQKWIQGKVSYYKELRGGVVAVESVPRSVSGKLLRRILRDQAIAEMRRQVKTHL
ncbi:uncharacterized protein EI90DRAFT_3035186 [Cantharellus anzutake]|uniref:uncharacterized protein n=1 Tax=Cantharellus anzutake TaxID=1750568 RepID=UPI0019037CFE|nr:uncharacterized protein EI90DRAFT_3035186 [Cantharellus anzutake]KAF8340323.1 hypothetical protein EI90DRAFT_3035186 [Cantharellus anzutake]